MKIALISTVYNEAATISRWIDAMQRQTVHPDEFVIVDGGSTDDTVRKIDEGFANGPFPRPKIIVRHCNIAGGRNLAISNTSADIIAATDAGSWPEPAWLDEITKPFAAHPDVAVVGGESIFLGENEFQRRIARYMTSASLPEGADCSPSSRNTAFRRLGWEAVGGYPEWLTLTAEDSLFNLNLHYAGFRFYHQPSAVVAWGGRTDAADFYKMVRGYGFGAAEAGHAYRIRELLLTTLIPPLILISPHPMGDGVFRYRRNSSAAWGWILGKLKGHRPPPGWKWLAGGWMSPQAQACQSSVHERERLPS